MYAYISGVLQHKGTSIIIVETGGIGYKINASAATLAQLGESGANVKIYTHLHVREDDMSLFGFASQEELSMFELVITVSGVGPKVALALLSAVSPSKFSLSVITGDAKALTQAKGVGLKVAQRIILELKDKLGSIGGDISEIMESADKIMATDEKAEAVNALMALGYTKGEAMSAMAAIKEINLSAEEYVKKALKQLI